MIVQTNARTKKKRSVALGRDLHTQMELYGMLLPGTISMIVFNIVPLFGLLIAFKSFRPVMGFNGIFTAPWNNFAHFKVIFNSPQFYTMIKNTIGINLLGQMVSITVTILFALLLNEITSARFKSIVQTAAYMPHFLSWVVFGGLCINLLSPDGGVINKILTGAHIVKEPILFLASPKYFWGVAIFTGLAKDLGWGAILYLAAIAGIDPTLYEAGTIDGANRWQKMRYITIPGIRSTVMILVIFAVAGMLNNNFTQIYVMQNVLNKPSSQVIDTYVYEVGIQNFQFGVDAAISMMKSVFAVLLLLLANFASNKLTESGLF